MMTPDSQDAATSHPSKEPVIWSLGAAAIAGAALLLAYASPLALAVGVVVLSVAATAIAISHRIAERNAPKEDRESTAAKIAACMENVNLAAEEYWIASRR